MSKTQPIKLGVIMDDISQIKPYKDTTLALMLGAQKRNWQIFYILQENLYLKNGKSFANLQKVEVTDSTSNWFKLDDFQNLALSDLDIILMRKDPPVDKNFTTATWILSIAEKEGVFVVNNPSSLRDCNEKLYAQEFPQITPPTLVTTDLNLIKEFWQEHKDIILKPLDGMGGAGVFRVAENGLNLSAIVENLNGAYKEQIMVQKYIPEIKDGDTRILLIDGEPIEYGLARIPKDGETRGNIAAGGTGVGRALKERDYFIVDQVKASVKSKGLYLVGLDVIGDYLTEINVTSPTCVRELESQYGIDIVGKLLDKLQEALQNRK